MNSQRPPQDDRALRPPAPACLANVRVVLVEPQTPGNVGAVARALKTMGLSQLVLVNPAPFREAEETWYMAHGAAEIVEAAQVVDTLPEALTDVQYVVGTTHRRRAGILQEPRPAREAAVEIAARTRTQTVALVFGREDHGLSQWELGLCQLYASIPAATRWPALNLAQAVQVMAYEIFLASLEALPRKPTRPAAWSDAEALCQRLLRLMMRMGFVPKRNDPEVFARALRRVFGRAGLEKQDLATLHQIGNVMEDYLEATEREA
jgi:TrmH family RNA methyltransferase